MSLETIELKNITKIFSNKKVLDDFSMTFNKGKIYALFGENGAGKSTLVKILTGLVEKTKGTIKLNSNEVSFKSPYDAINCGIGIIHQNPYLLEDATVFENIVIGVNTPKKLFFNFKKFKTKIKSLMDLLSVELNLDAKVNTLTMEKKFYTAFIAVMFNNPDFIIFDEPLQDFSNEIKLNFFDKLKELTLSNKLGIIFITHKLNEILKFVDYVSVLKKGRLIKTFPAISKDEIQTLITEPAKINQLHQDILKPVPALIIQNFTVSNYLDIQSKNKTISISLKAYKKNITTISISSDSEFHIIENMFFGTLPEKYKNQATGTIKFLNNNVKRKTINANHITPKILRQNNVALIPADRYFKGSNPKLTIYEMLISNNCNTFFLNRSKKIEICKNILSEQKIDATPNMPVATLSGGELQRLILARELYSNPDILILSRPEQGLDSEKKEHLKIILKKQKEMNTSIIILTGFSEDNILKDIFDKNYLYKNGRLCEI
ncbi:MAG: hypothetical protein CR988_02190 [Treponema sp.]|nr:MAG: hypothetical protein CR988_02190 [Treponema sp.]